MAKRDKREIKEQENRARMLFGSISALLFVSIFLLLVFQFGLLGAAPANQMQPAPTPAANAEAAPTTPILTTPGATTAAVTLVKTPAAIGSTYLTWVFAALIGVSLYLLANIVKFYPKVEEDATDYKVYTYWYLVNIFRAPVLAMVVLWILTNIQINLGAGGQDSVTGVAVVFSNFPDIVLIAVAFILGYYARVSLKQMDIIAKGLFTQAWAMAEEGFAVVGPAVLLLKDQYTFRTDPPSDVVWTATGGTMDAESGVYSALDSLDADGKHVIVRAALRSNPSKTDFKGFMLKLMDISGPAEIEPGVDTGLGITTKLSDILTDAVLDTVAWSTEPKDYITGGVKTGKAITINSQDAVAGATIKVKISSTLTGNNNKVVTAEKTLTVKKKRDI